MTFAIDASALPTRRQVRRGWRPRYEGEFPTLGWQILDFLTAHLPSPRDERLPLRLTDEQARRILRIYELNPATGQRLVRRVHEEEAKGWGKGPYSGILMIAEFKGPVLFDGWDAEGQPVGRPWGMAGSPAPWIQAAAVSEAQTANVWTAMHALLGARNGAVADGLHIDPGITRCYATDMPGAFMERVTASAGSREGQPITHAVLDEVQLWDRSNGGDVLARTILRNLTKTNGWAHFTGNAPATGLEKVAEEWWGEPGPGVYRFAIRPSERPQQDWGDDRKLAALREVYRDVPWMLDHIERILADVNEPKVPWDETLRYSFNVRTDGGVDERWIPQGVWDECAGKVDLDPKLPTYVDVSVAADYRSAAIAAAQMQGGRVAVTVRTFTAPADDLVKVSELEDYVLGLRTRFPAKVWAPMVFLDGRTRERFQAGPEVLYNGPYFEGSRQRLEAAGIAMRVEPHSPIRQWEAAQTLKTLALRAELVHEDDPEITHQIGNLTVHASGATQTVKHAGPAANAVMTAVRQADLKAKTPKGSNAVFHSW